MPDDSQCFMAENDELLGKTYRQKMEAYLPVMSIPGGHRLFEDAMPIIKEALMKTQENT